ncbi:MAG: GNAT family N-acetyltransferase [Roseibium sp.]|uniref:GNAT family N-acetyltransferase n=1 Tax=Roseibium sp. TaxID=1936156 RepID=UPI0026391581|nr:GNAT family N-acetyltransferase [Roseibium sp.]MCV0427727.1 GNAT family N-acetyltransferase [Roseibium sp.]
MILRIRSGQQTDVAACVDILRDWAAETPWMAELDERQSMQRFWSDIFRTDLAWIAEMGNRIVGFCTRNDDNIGALYVVAEARSTGIGKRLLDMAKADREENLHALRFYKREGLVEIGREIESESNLMNIEHRWTRPS